MAGGRIWTTAEDDYVEFNAGTRSLSQIAKHLGRSETAVKCRIFRQGFTARGNSGYMSACEVAEMYGCPEKRVHVFLQKGILRAKKFQGKHKRWLILPEDAAAIAPHLSQRKHVRSGHLLGNSKLTERDIIEIRKRHPKESYAALGREYGVNRQTIYRAVKGLTWQHLKPKEWWEPRG